MKFGNYPYRLSISLKINKIIAHLLIQYLTQFSIFSVKILYFYLFQIFFKPRSYSIFSKMSKRRISYIVKQPRTCENVGYPVGFFMTEIGIKIIFYYLISDRLGKRSCKRWNLYRMGQSCPYKVIFLKGKNLRFIL